jgi:hypothetical protein
MDGASNEYEGVEIEGFPTLYFFKGGPGSSKNKLSNKKVFEGERNVSSILSFLQQNVYHNITDIVTLENEAAIEEAEKKEEESEAEAPEGEGEGQEGEGQEGEPQEGEGQEPQEGDESNQDQEPVEGDDNSSQQEEGQPEAKQDL